MESTPSELDKPLILPNRLRDELKKIHGKIMREDELPQHLKNRTFYCVGDVVTYTLLKLNLLPKVAVVDYKTKRERVDFEFIKDFGDLILKAHNPPGMITPELWDAVKRAIQTPLRVRIDVIGEEDLAVIPMVHFSPMGAMVIYGMPYTGLIVLEVNEEHKKNVARIIREMEV